MNEHLIAHYPLANDCRDNSGHERHGRSHGVAFTGKVAAFDGQSSHVDVAHSEGLVLGHDPFSICAWIHTDRDASDPIGDLVSKYDPGSRKGVNLCLQTFHGVTSSQANYRNLLFGIDSGSTPQWQDCGRPGDAVLVFALCVFEGALYAGTFEMGAEGRGRVYRYADDGTWTYCGTPHGSNAVSSLCAHEGHLYAATSHYRSQGSALGEAENSVHGGHVYRYEGGEKWLDFGKLGESEAIGGMVTREGRLYASSMYAPPALFRYEHGEGWENLGNPGGRVVALTVHDGAILGSGYDLGYSGVYRYGMDGEWSDWGTPPETTQTYSFMQYDGRLYVGTWPTGKVFRYGGDSQWEDCGRLGEELEVMPMVSYNGKLYAGTLPSAQVYRYESDGHWTNLGAIDTTPDVKYRRAWSMAVYKGRLFCGTLPSGKVWSTEAGVCASHDAAFPTGWHHVAAVRDAGSLKLYVDGALVAQSREFDAATFDVSNDRPLMLGRGGHDYFNGRMADVRVYGAALDGAEIQQLMEGSRPE